MMAANADAQRLEDAQPERSVSPPETGNVRIAVVMGTRPEAIKLCPVLKALGDVAPLQPFAVSTGQHRQMLDQVFAAFGVTPDVDLSLMQPDQTLSSLMSVAITRLDGLFATARPAAVLVQGDTTTALSAALAAFHRRIPIGHVEAGLRTYDLTAPFPEEANRSLIGRIATWNYAPTDRSVAALEAERVPGDILKTGNTVVDALLQTAERVDAAPVPLTRDRLVLITGHRRENFGDRFREAFQAIAELADRYPDVDYVYPVHLNPNVQEHAYGILQGRPNVQLIAPVSYPDLIALMKRAWLILTDSGGIQEEAPSFGVPVLVMRDTTERPEAVEAGVAQLVGTNRASIVGAVSGLLDDPARRAAIAAVENPFGDGFAAIRIAKHLRDVLAWQADAPALAKRA